MSRRGDYIVSFALYLALGLVLLVAAKMSLLAAFVLSFGCFLAHDYLLSMFGQDDIYEAHSRSVRAAIGDHLFAFAPSALLCAVVTVVSRGA